MSGDVGLDEPIIFYTKKMTQTKVVLLKQKGIELNWKEVKPVSYTHLRAHETRDDLGYRNSH